MPSTWQELLLEEDQSLKKDLEDLTKEARELEKKRKLTPDEERRRGERMRVIQDQRTELQSEIDKHRAQGLQEIARRVPKQRIPGIFEKEVLVYENERVVLLIDGAIQGILGPGVYTVGGLMRDVKTGAILSKIKMGHAESVDVIFVNLADIDIKWGFPTELWTQDGLRVGAHGVLRLKISEPDIAKLFANMMDMTAQRIRVEDLRSRIGLELLGSVVAPVMKNYKIDDLWGNKEVIEDCYSGIETEMRKTMSRWGFELVQFTINYNFPEIWLKRKEQTATLPLQLAQAVDERIKYPTEFWRANFVANRDVDLLKKQYEQESKLLDSQYGHELDILGKKHEGELKQQEIANQDYDITLGQKRHDFELATDRADYDQGLDFKRGLDRLNLDRETSQAQLRQSTETARVTLEEQQKDFQHKRDVESLKTESDGRAQRLQILVTSGSSDAIVRGLESETLSKIADRGSAAEAAEAIRAKYNLQTHEDAEARAVKLVSDVIAVAKVPPVQPIIIPPAGSVPVAVPPVLTPAPAPSPTPSVPPARPLDQQPPAQPDTPGKDCPNCRTTNLAIARFCTSCGAKL